MKYYVSNKTSDQFRVSVSDTISCPFIISTTKILAFSKLDSPIDVIPSRFCLIKHYGLIRRDGQLRATVINAESFQFITAQNTNLCFLLY